MKIANKHFFSESLEFYRSLNHVCELFDIGDVIAEPIKLFGGLLHELWFISTTEGNFALKKVNEKNWSLLEKTILPVDLAENLAWHHQQRGLRTRVALESSAKKRLERCQEGHAWMVYPWIEGKVRSQQDITLADVQRIGQLLIKIQASAPQLSDLSLPNWFGFSVAHWEALVEQAQNKAMPWARTAKKSLNSLINWSTEAATAAPLLQSNLIVSHRDLSASNIIWLPDNRPVVIDWEYAGLVNPESEIFNTAMIWSYRGECTFDMESFEAFVDATEITFTIAKPALWAGFAGYLLEWCEFNMQRSLQETPASDAADAEVINVINILNHYQ